MYYATVRIGGRNSFCKKIEHRIVGVFPDANGIGKPDIWMAKRIKRRFMMAKEKLITNAQIKKAIKNCEHDECIELILEIVQACPQAREFLTIKFTDNQNDILEKYKQKVRYEFYPPRGFGRLNLREAKKAISDFKKLSTDKNMLIDLMLYYVENCVEFTNEYGDISETFYSSAENVYLQVVSEVNSLGTSAYDKFAERLSTVVNDTSNIGWGFHECLSDIFHELEK